MEKQKKVLNVIKGYMSKFDIEQVTIIEDDKESVIFSGDVEKFLHPCETMQNEASDFGMTVSSRCRLVVPKAKETKPENKFAKYASS